MERLQFIVAEKSYLVRKGMVSIINRIEGAVVIKEMDNLDNINSEILTLNPDFLLVNPNLIPKSEDHRNFHINMDLSEKVIAILTVSPYRKGMLPVFREIIDLQDSKEVIYQKLKSIINPALRESPGSFISNELSEREKTILAYVAKGMTNKEIAEILFLSTHTVITHRKNITSKLGIKTISGLTIYAILNNLIKMEDVR
ncbi:MAG: LuxR C-terminal-related transcriptional regulator [Bacteroidales bacterium]|nr:LuxR C-terminal-related transcriptional regulator [Bacteroidales bacterium]MCF8406202.1 LuxR C-terminal-related transcriptional regulator [Bacteroidales bacterium]